MKYKTPSLSRMIFSLSVGIFLSFSLYYALEFLSFHFLAYSDMHDVLRCRNHLRSIYVALQQYEESRGQPPDQLLRLVETGYLDSKRLKCPLFNKVWWFGLGFQYDRKNVCDYSYHRPNAIITEPPRDDEIICSDHHVNHDNSVFGVNVLYRGGRISEIPPASDMEKRDDRIRKEQSAKRSLFIILGLLSFIMLVIEAWIWKTKKRK